jgi:hypothetical protein
MVPGKQGRERDKRKPRQEMRFMNPSTAPHLSAAIPFHIVGGLLTPIAGSATQMGGSTRITITWQLKHPYETQLGDLFA